MEKTEKVKSNILNDDVEERGILIASEFNNILIERAKDIYTKTKGYMFETNDENVFFKLITGIPFENDEYFEWVLTRDKSDPLYNKANSGAPTIIDLCLFMIYILGDFQNDKYKRNDNQKIINIIAERAKLNGQFLEKESANSKGKSHIIRSDHVTNARKNKEKDDVIKKIFEK